jgi:hypothetical protein
MRYSTPQSNQEELQTIMSDFIETNSNDDGIDRRGFLKCMAWAGTGVIWSINGGLLTSTVLGQEANNRNAIATAELNFVQISDSHIGFNKPANTDDRRDVSGDDYAYQRVTEGTRVPAAYRRFNASF